MSKYGIKDRDCNKAMLTVEEAAGSLISHRRAEDSGSPGELFIFVRGFLGTVSIELSLKGEEYSLENNMASITLNEDQEPVDDIQDSIRKIILSSMTDSIKYRHKDGINYIRMTVIKSKRAFLYQTIGAMIISIIVLSMGAPGIPGSGLICLSVLLAQMNVPLESIGLIMGIDSLCGMFRTMSNCLGDVAVSTIVAKNEKELDLTIYNS